MLVVISKVRGIRLDWYSFHLEHRYKLSNQKLRSWVWDELKGFLVSCSFRVGYWLSCSISSYAEFPQHWWVMAWLGFLGVAVLLAQLAPVVAVSDFLQIRAAAG